MYIFPSVFKFHGQRRALHLVLKKIKYLPSVASKKYLFEEGQPLLDVQKLHGSNPILIKSNEIVKIIIPMLR